MNRKLYKRTVFDQIVKYLFTDDIIVLHGARQVGKTHLLYYIHQHLQTKNRLTHYIDLEDSRYVQILDDGVDAFVQYLKEKNLDVALLKKQEKIFVLIDEIQYLKNPSSLLKLVSDHYKGIKLIVSGSSSFAIKSKFQDSLVGRTVNFEIFPLSFIEFLGFKEHPIHLETLQAPDVTKKTELELRALFKEFVLYGGYPKIVLTNNVEFKETYLQQIIDTYIKKDIKDLANIKEIEKFNKLVEVLASQSGQLVEVAELSNTCRLAKQTIEHYLFILEHTYVIKLVRPFHKNIRSELFKTPKIFFYDSGLMQMLWLKQLQKEILGSVFETAVFSELVKKYGQDHVFHWRTTDKKEIDFIIATANTLLPIEAKINFSKFDKRHIAYFCDTYHIKNYIVTALLGDLETKYFYHPWSL